MKRLILIAVLVSANFACFSQKYVVEKGRVSFFSDATIEDIKADNVKSVSIINTTTADVAFSIPVAEFQFEKELMQEHFNEKYLETDKYPKATFQGKIEGFLLSTTTQQTVKAVGKLSLHGITKDVSIPGTILVTNNKLALESKFIVKLADYEIKIPQLMWQNIAEQVEVTLNFTYKPQ
jgi:polyisoprenoid-binding protein YceI